VSGISARRTPSVAEARAIQERLRARVRVTGGPRRPRLVAGADLAYRADGSRAWAAVVLVSLPDGVVVETATAWHRPRFPYIPGYLSFREGPLLLAAFGRLERRPDLCLFDGQGIAHPRGVGLASHMGVLLDLPSVGCAKSRLVGKHDEPGAGRGDWAPLRLEDHPRGERRRKARRCGQRERRRDDTLAESPGAGERRCGVHPKSLRATSETAPRLVG